MLPSRLLDLRPTDDGSVRPSWLTPRDDVWLRELAAEAAASEGRRVDAANERIVDLVAPLARRHGVPRRVVEAVWLVERRRWKTRIAAPAPPERIRRVLFELAAERSREEALATAAHELGIDVSEVEPSLFADRAHARTLVAPPAVASAAELGAAYNLALAQALLGRATEVVARVRAHLHAVVRYAKLLGLMAAFDEDDAGTTRMTVSGPLALFHDTLKYGRALAAWFPSVVATPGWAVDARVLLGGESRRLVLDASSPLPRTHALAREHDSKLEARLDKALRRLGSSWRVERETAVVRAGARLFFPDFSLTSERGRVLVEVVGFWTPEYLAEKAALLRAVSAPLVVCADERHAREALAGDSRVVFFRGSVDAPMLVEACERALAEHRPRGGRALDGNATSRPTGAPPSE
jgi:predicted nuclease of restriction endonuclease-like RecB superfamily